MLTRDELDTIVTRWAYDDEGCHGEVTAEQACADIRALIAEVFSCWMGRDWDEWHKREPIIIPAKDFGGVTEHWSKGLILQKMGEKLRKSSEKDPSTPDIDPPTAENGQK